MDLIELKKVIHETNVELINSAPKTSIGLMGSITAMTINDLVGLIVGTLTAFYMILQIKSALKRNKEIKEKIKKN